jgi:hypothetical protein
MPRLAAHLYDLVIIIPSRMRIFALNEKSQIIADLALLCGSGGA